MGSRGIVKDARDQIESDCMIINNQYIGTIRQRTDQMIKSTSVTSILRSNYGMQHKWEVYKHSFYCNNCIGDNHGADWLSCPSTIRVFPRRSSTFRTGCRRESSNVLTFAAEMREVSFILQNIEPRSMVIVDEPGRGTRATDGLAIAIAC
jgi:hypothetical protein